MLYEIYTAIKSHINASDTEGVIKGIEWYNVQYEATIATTPRIFVEFPDPLKFDQLSKDTMRTPVKVRLHIVSQALATTDGVVSDSTASDHEAVATEVYNWINGLKPAGLTTLHLTGWQHWHKYKGWMVTFVEFTASKLL